MSNTESTAKPDRAATLRAIADSGLPMPREISFDRQSASVTLTLESLRDLEAWAYHASASTVVFRQPGKNELLFTWNVGRWQGWEWHLYAFESAAAVAA